MKITKLLVTTVISAGLAFGVAAQATEEKAEQTVDMKSLPVPVQKTIKEKAAGGEIVKVEKENDKGKWNYEVHVKSKGKEWGFEVDKDGKYIGKHDEAKEQHKEKGEKY
jgi:uncharacterized membrane protein YkoI